MTRWFNGQIQYTLAADNDTNGIMGVPRNDYDPSGEWGTADAIVGIASTWSVTVIGGSSISASP